MPSWEIMAAPREHSIPSKQPQNLAKARTVYYTKHQGASKPPPLGSSASGPLLKSKRTPQNTSTQPVPEYQSKQSQLVSPLSSSKVFQYGQNQRLQRHGVDNEATRQSHIIVTQQRRPTKRHRLSQNDMKQVCAEGDNEFAESIAENSILKESIPVGKEPRDQARKRGVRSKPAETKH